MVRSCGRAGCDLFSPDSWGGLELWIQNSTAQIFMCCCQVWQECLVMHAIVFVSLGGTMGQMVHIEAKTAVRRRSKKTPVHHLCLCCYGLCLVFHWSWWAAVCQDAISKDCILRNTLRNLESCCCSCDSVNGWGWWKAMRISENNIEHREHMREQKVHKDCKTMQNIHKPKAIQNSKIAFWGNADKQPTPFTYH